MNRQRDIIVSSLSNDGIRSRRPQQSRRSDDQQLTMSRIRSLALKAQSESIDRSTHMTRLARATLTATPSSSARIAAGYSEELLNDRSYCPRTFRTGRCRQRCV